MSGPNDGQRNAGSRIPVGEPIISEFERQRRFEGRLWAEGYTQAELEAAQEKYGLSFPPDLVALFRDRRPVLGYDWRRDDDDIRAMLKWPLEGLLFDAENSGLWWPEWGERPRAPAERAEVVGRVVSDAPKLIPLVSHRYLPTEPHEAGNPVFSIYQSDAIYYGANLADYF
ncbi:MAG TPA: SMI1/KNR4 family protein [Caulobacteraceae bacterium]